MIRYNWKALKIRTKNDPTKVVEFFRHTLQPKMNMPDYVRRTLLSTSTKDSFLLNNKDFSSNTLRGTILERYWYIYLASKRNYADYAVKGNLWLYTALCDVDVSNNRLLIINNNKIHFKYEEQ